MTYSFYCLFLGVVLLPLKKVLFLPMVEHKLLLADLFLLLSGCCALFEKEACKRTFQLRSLCVVFFIFLVWLALSSFMSLEAFSSATRTQLEILTLCYDIYLLLLLIVVVDSSKKFFFTLVGWILAILISNVLAFYSLLEVPDWGFSYGILIGSFVGANQPQIVLLPLLPLLVFIASLKEVSNVVRGSLVVLVSCSVLFVLISGSRCGYLMLGLQWIGCSVLYWRARQYSFSLSSVVFWGQQVGYALLLLLVLFFGVKFAQSYKPLAGVQRVNLTFNQLVFIKDKKPAQFSNVAYFDKVSSGRIGIIKSGFSLFKENLLFGYGLQQTRNLKGAHSHEMHSGYLALLFETGIIGFLLGGYLIYMVLKRVPIVLKGRVNFFEWLVLQSLLIGLTELALYNLFTNGLRQRELWLLLGLLFVVTYTERSDGAYGVCEKDNFAFDLAKTCGHKVKPLS
ncbi:O-antigen ligase family protein [Halodesulfovibrio aestuarii]|uniref:O-Antigen ligase n=1 Tax=Halodesulfovibrio aestuarii TaxID=126333 RepID=A0A8G2CAC6_9BACT|nr:O-antigen ligase family protein [Halodesulfovibrio aestuarii]SHJ29196.1 O-Antigen ligase [Halodesulfovibrio aestuarii]